MQSSLTQNYFELFGLPVTFEIDQQQLAGQYRELQKSVHPDKYANASDQEKRYAVQMAAHINHANQTLKSPQSRARYMLELRGIQFDDEKDTHLDPAFLMEQIELRESLESVTEQTDPQAALDAVFQTLRDKQKQIMKTFADSLQSDDMDQLQAIKKEVQKLQFLNKLQHEAENIEEQLLEES